MLYSHPQHRQFVQFAGHGVAGGDQRRQLIDETVHFISAPLLNLTVGFSVEEQEKKGGDEDHDDEDEPYLHTEQTSC